jgi:hypothetical protein
MTSHQGKTPDLAVIPANAGIQGLKKHVSGCRLAPPRGLPSGRAGMTGFLFMGVLKIVPWPFDSFV